MSLIVIEGSNGSGKTETIKRITGIYDVIDKKSIPDWYRDEITVARTKSWDIQKEIYLIGHNINFYECSEDKDYILDRFSYSTIIRINYGMGISIDDTVNEILDLENIPDLIIVLKSEKNTIKERLLSRDRFDFDENFFDYENQIYEHLAKIFDIMYIVDNNETIDVTVDKVSRIIDFNTKVRKKAKNERRV